MGLTAPPAPGIYPDVDFATYLSWDCASRSTLSHLANWRDYTPQDVRHEMLTGSPGSDAMALGTALHAMTLEPETFVDEVAIAPKVDKRTKQGKADWAEFVEQSDGKTVITKDQGFVMADMHRAILDCPKAVSILNAADAKELTIVANLDLKAMTEELGQVWEGGEDTHLLVKCRLDMHCPRLSLVADLKTTKEKTEWGLQRAFDKLGYSHQAALYPAVARAAGLEADQFAAIFVRNEAPFRAGVFRAEEQSVRAAWGQLLPAMVEMAECYRTEEWPGWGDEVQDISLPDYRPRELER